jgi:POT family proton-dependent oligopeptide transporter
VTYEFRIHELALKTEIANDKPRGLDKLNMELGFSAPRGSIQHEKPSVLDRPNSETAYSGNFR